MGMPGGTFLKRSTAANADRPTLRTVQRWRSLVRAGRSLAPGKSTGRPRQWRAPPPRSGPWEPPPAGL